MRTITLILIFGVCIVSSGGEQCSSQCSHDARYSFEPGNTYRYTYKGETQTSLLQNAADSTTPQSQVFFSMLVDIYVESPCEMILTLSRVKVKETSDSSTRHIESSAIKTQLEEKPVRFSFQNGLIELVCGDSDDATWALNFKKGIISSLQNTMPSFAEDTIVFETDVVGTCKTEYNVESRTNDIVIRKTKQTEACESRGQVFTSIQALPNDMDQESALLTSSHQCYQTIRSGILVRTLCEEEHVFAPLSDEDRQGAVTSVKQVLEYDSVVNKYAPYIGRMVPASLLYNHNEIVSDGFTEALQLLEELCLSSKADLARSDNFFQLVQVMRRSDIETLKLIYHSVKIGGYCDLAQTGLNDAITALRTPDVLPLIQELITSYDIPEDTKANWIQSIAFINNPTLETIEHASELLRESLDVRPIVPVSTMVAKFCQKSENCEVNTSPVHAILSILKENLGNACFLENNEIGDTIVLHTLKGLEIIGIDSDLTATLQHCIQNTAINTESRLAAAHTLKKLPCTTSRESVLDILLDSNENPEIRIATYRAMIQCPTSSLCNEIAEMLRLDLSKQVGSFIWTHLINMKQMDRITLSNNLERILEDDHIKQRFDSDPMKYSRHFIGSHSFERLDAETEYEGNIVYAPNSYLPRSAELDITTHMFGHSFDILQFSGRAEGLETFLEQIAGPREFSERAGQESTISENRHLFANRENIHTSGSLKMLGNDFDLWNTKDLKADISRYSDLLSSFVNREEYSIKRSVIFMDSFLRIPTILGLPLKLGVNGSVSTDVRLSGKLDLRSMALSPHNLDIESTIKPSAVVTINAGMGIDFMTSHAGLRLVASMTTATEATAKLRFRNGQVFKASLEIPDEKQEIIQIRGDVMRFTNGVMESIFEESADVEAGHTTCSSPDTAHAAGLQLCYAFNFDKPFLAKVELEKTDTHSVYEIEARYETKKEIINNNLKITDVARISFNTPRSTINREFLAEVVIDQSNLEMTAQVKTPWKQVDFHSSLTNTAYRKGGTLQLSVDQHTVATFTTHLEMEGQKRRTAYAGFLDLQLSTPSEIKVSGEVAYVTGRALTAQVIVGGFGTNSSLSYNLQMVDNGRYASEMIILTPLVEVHVDSIFAAREHFLNFRNTLMFRRKHQTAESLNVQIRLRRRATGPQVRYTMDGGFESSQFPKLNVYLDSSLLLTSDLFNGSLDLIYGSLRRDRANQILLNCGGSWSGGLTVIQLQNYINITWRNMGIDIGGRIDYEHDISADERMVRVTSSLTSGPDQQLRGDLSFRNHIDSESVRFSSEIEYNNSPMLTFSGNMSKEDDVYVLKLNSAVPLGMSLQIDFRPIINDLLIRILMQNNDETYKKEFHWEHRIDLNRIEFKTTWDAQMNSFDTIGDVHLLCGTNLVLITSDISAQSNDYVISLKYDSANSSDGHAKLTYPGRKMFMKFYKARYNDEVKHKILLSWKRGKTITIDINGQFSINDTHHNISPHITINGPSFDEIEMYLNTQRSKNSVHYILGVRYGETYSSHVAAVRSNDWSQANFECSIHTPLTYVDEINMAGSYGTTEDAGHAEIRIGSDYLDSSFIVSYALVENSVNALNASFSLRSDWLEEFATIGEFTRNSTHLSGIIHGNYGTRTFRVAGEIEKSAVNILVTVAIQIDEHKSNLYLHVMNNATVSYLKTNVVLNGRDIFRYVIDIANGTMHTDLQTRHPLINENMLFLNFLIHTELPIKTSLGIRWKSQDVLILNATMNECNSNQFDGHVVIRGESFEETGISVHFNKQDSRVLFNSELQYASKRSVIAFTRKPTEGFERWNLTVQSPYPLLRYLDIQTQFRSISNFSSKIELVRTSLVDLRNTIHNSIDIRNSISTSSMRSSISNQWYTLEHFLIRDDMFNDGFESSALRFGNDMEIHTGLVVDMSFSHSLDRLSGDLDHSNPSSVGSLMMRFYDDFFVNVSFADVQNRNGHVTESGITYNDRPVMYLRLDRAIQDSQKRFDISSFVRLSDVYNIEIYSNGSQSESSANIVANVKSGMFPDGILFETQGFCVVSTLQCNISTRLKYAPTKEILTSAYLGGRGSMRAGFDLITPFDQLSMIHAEFDLKRMLPAKGDFKLEFDVANLQRSIQGNFDVNINTLLQEANIICALQSNIRHLETASLNMNVKLMDDYRVESTCEIQNSQYRIYLENEGYYESFSHFGNRLEIVSPISVVIQVNHQIDDNGFSNTFLFEIDETRFEYGGSFQSITPVSGVFLLKTPFFLLEEVNLAFTADKITMMFDSNFNIIYAGDEIIYEGLFALSRGIETALFLSTPYFSDLKMSVSHIGGFNFVHKSEVGYGDYAIVLTSELQTASFSGTRGKVTLETPFTHVRSLEAVADWDLFSTGFNGNLEMWHNERNFIQLGSYFTRREDAIATIQFKTNVPVIGEVEVEYHHELSWPISSISMVVKYEQDIVSLETGFNTFPIRMYFIFTSPYYLTQRIHFEGTADGNSRRCTCNLTSEVNSNSVSLEAGWNFRQQFSANYKLVSILPVLQHNFTSQCSIRYTSTTERFQTDFDFAYNERQIDWHLEFQKHPLYGNVVFRSSFETFRRLSLTLFKNENADSEGPTPLNQNMMGEMVFEGTLPLMTHIERLHTTLREGNTFVFDLLGDIEYVKSQRNNEQRRRNVPVQVQFTLNGIHEVQSDHHFSSDDKVINSIGIIMIEDQPLLNMQAHAAFNEDSNGHFHIKTEYLNEFQRILRHFEKMQKLGLTADLSRNEQSIVSGHLNYTCGDGHVNLDIQTHGQYFSPLNLLLHYQRFGTTFWNVQFDNNYMSQGNFSLGSNPFLFGMLLKAPTGIFEEIEVLYEYSRNNMEMIAEGSIIYNKAFTYSLDFYMSETNVHGKVLLPECVWLDNIRITFNHDGTLVDFTNTANVKYGDVLFRASTVFELQPLQLNLNLETPYDGYESVGFKITQNGNILRAYEGLLDLRYKSDKSITLAVDIRRIRGFHSSITLNTPVGMLKSKMRHLLENDKLRNTLNFQCNDNEIKITTVVHITSKPKGWIEISTPFEGFTLIKGEFKYEVTRNMFATLGKLDIDSHSSSINIYALFYTWHEMEGRFIIRTPFEGARTIGISASNYESPTESEQCKIEILLPEDIIINGSIVYNIEHVTFTVNGSIYVDSEEHTRVILAHSGETWNRETHATVDYKEIQVVGATLKTRNLNAIVGLEISYDLAGSFIPVSSLSASVGIRTHCFPIAVLSLEINKTHKAFFKPTFDECDFSGLSLLVKSPLASGSYVANISYTDNHIAFATDVDTLALNNGRVTAMIAAKYSTNVIEKNIECDVIITTPYTNWNDLRFAINQVNRDHEVFSTVHVHHDENTLNISTTYQIVDGFHFENDICLTVDDSSRGREERAFCYHVKLAKMDNQNHDFELYLISPLRQIYSTLTEIDDFWTLNLRWDAFRDESKQVTVIRRGSVEADDYSNDITVQSPLLNHDISLTSNAVLYAGDILFKTKHTLIYSNDPRQHLIVYVKVLRDYSCEVDMEHAASNLYLNVGTDRQQTPESDTLQTTVKWAMADNSLKQLHLTMGSVTSTPIWYIEVASPDGNWNGRIDVNIKEPTAMASLMFEVREEKLSILLTQQNRSHTLEITTTFASVKIETAPHHNLRELRMFSGRHALDGPEENHTPASRTRFEKALSIETGVDKFGDIVLRVFWKKNVHRELKNITSSMITDLRRTGLYCNRILREIGEEGYTKLQLLKNEETIDSIRTFFREETSILIRQYHRMWRMLLRAYSKNAFFIKSLYVPLRDTVDMIDEFFSGLNGHIWRHIYIYSRRFCDEILLPIQTGLCRPVGRLILSIPAKVDMFLNSWVAFLENFIDTFKYWFSSICNHPIVEQALQYCSPDRISTILSSIYSHLGSAIQDISSLINGLSNSAFLERFTDMMSNAASIFPSNFRNAMNYGFLKDMFYGIHSVINDNEARNFYEDMTSLAGASSARIKNSLQPIFLSFLNDIVLENNVNDTLLRMLWNELNQEITEITTSFDDATAKYKLMTLFNEMVSGPANPFKDMLYITALNDSETKEAHLEIGLRVPTQIPASLRLKFTVVNAVIKALRGAAVDIAKVLLNKSPQQISFPLPWRHWFQASGVVIKDRIITFDDNYVLLEQACDITLTRDVITGTFTVKYNPGMRAITIIKGQKQITISASGNVSVDSYPITLPQQDEEIRIALVNDIVEVNSPHLFRIEYHLQHEMFVITVSGWYRGKLAGVLGTYTNDRYDDFALPSGEISNSQRKFIRNWENDNGCRRNKKPILNNQHAANVDIHGCRSTFNGATAAYSICYSAVDNHNFLRLCQDNNLGNGFMPQDTYCATVLSYFAKCHAAQIHVPVSQLCGS